MKLKKSEFRNRVSNFSWNKASKTKQAQVLAMWKQDNQGKTLKEYRNEYKQLVNARVKANRYRKLEQKAYEVSNKFGADLKQTNYDTRNITKGILNHANKRGSKEKMGNIFTLGTKDYKREMSYLGRLKKEDPTTFTTNKVKDIVGSKFLKKLNISTKNKVGADVIIDLGKANDSTDFYKDYRDEIIDYNNTNKDGSTIEARALDIIYHSNAPQEAINTFTSSKKTEKDYIALFKVSNEYIEQQENAWNENGIIKGF